MAVTLKGYTANYLGLSTDAKPTEADDNAIFRELDTGKRYYFTGAAWAEIPSSGGGGGGDVTSVNGKTGAVTLTASDVGAYTTTETDALLADNQSKTLSASVKIGAESENTVEGAIGEVAAIIPATAAVSNKLSTAADTAKEYITATANSDNIALTDSAYARVHDLKIYGKTENGHSAGENGLTVTACGKNLFNGQWLAGKTIDNSTGEIIDTEQYNRFVSVDIRVNPLTTYFGYNDSKTEYFNVHCYDENLNWLGSCKADVNNNTFTTLANTAYIRLRNYVAGARGTKWAIYVSDPTINGQYIPYVSSSMTLPTALPLRGSYKTVDLGSLNWYYETEWVRGPQVTLPRFAVALGTLSDAYIPSEAFGVAMSSCSSRYTPMLDPYPEAADKILYIGKNKGLYIIDHDYTDAAAFKAAVTGITLTYPSYCDEIDLADGVAITRLDSNGDVLATPVTTPLSDAEKAAFAEFRTFDGNTNVTATDNPFMTLNYVRNTDNGKALADVDNKSAVRMAMIAAPYDDTATYAVGNYCTYGDRLWKCNTAIGTAEPFTATHWTATTVMEEI